MNTEGLGLAACWDIVWSSFALFDYEYLEAHGT